MYTSGRILGAQVREGETRQEVGVIRPQVLSRAQLVHGVDQVVG